MGRARRKHARWHAIAGRAAIDARRRAHIEGSGRQVAVWGAAVGGSSGAASAAAATGAGVHCAARGAGCLVL